MLVHLQPNYYQIWVFPDTQNVTPRYGQKKFDPADQQNTFQNVVSPKDDNDGKALWFHQQTYFNLGNFSKIQTIPIRLSKKATAYTFSY